VNTPREGIAIQAGISNERNYVRARTNACAPWFPAR
jgi:hypothetical protein